MPLNWDSRKTFDTFEEAVRYHESNKSAVPQRTYTHLDKWFDAVTAAVRSSVPGIFDDVDLAEAYKQLSRIVDAEPDEGTP